jgi:hypothetical protein
MRRLLQIGFEQVGSWRLRAQELALDLTKMNGHRNVLYAFVDNAEVLYVGKTTGTLESRMGGYLRPHASQRTNMRNNLALLQLLRHDRAIDIYAWADPGMHRIGEFHLNYAAGLEDSIIRTLAPPWNGARSASPTVVPVEQSVLGTPVLDELPALASSEDESVSAVEVRVLEDAGVIRAAPTFDVTLGKTYYHQGFFNVPIKFSGLFPEHGTQISIYCGDSRTLIRATVDRRANQSNKAPRIYGRASLANWFRLYKQLDQTAKIRVVSTNEIELA